VYLYQIAESFGNSTVTIATVDKDSVTQSFSKSRAKKYVEANWTAHGHLDETKKGGNLQQVFISHSWSARHDQ
jgi:hypothetical protein